MNMNIRKEEIDDVANEITELPLVVDVPDQPCQQLYEGNPVLLGFDVVHYHLIPSYNDGGVAQQGSSEFAYNFEGYQFWFVNQTNRDLFINDPWKYAPAFGGFCSWGVALELNPQWPWNFDFLGPPASPWEGWAVVDGVLVFNILADYTDKFMDEPHVNMQLAAERWKEWFGKQNAGPFNTHCIGHGPLQNWCISQQPSPWLEPLPNCTADGTGGGIVSEINEFRSFSNSGISPFYKRWIIGCALSPLALALIVYFLFVRYYKIGEESNFRDIDDDDDDHDDDIAALVVDKKLSTSSGETKDLDQESSELTASDSLAGDDSIVEDTDVENHGEDVNDNQVAGGNSSVTIKITKLSLDP